MSKLPIGIAVAVLLVVGLSAHAAFGRSFRAELTGAQEVLPVDTTMSGSANVRFDRDETEARFRVRVRDGQAVTQAHIHCGEAGQNGPAVVHLFGNIPGGFDVNGTLAAFTFTEDNITDAGATCSPAIATMPQLAQAARDGQLYVNVHTVAHPGGEIRGQLHE